MARPAIPKRTDAAKLRREQQAIAEDFVRRERASLQGDTASQPLKPYVPPAKPPLTKKRSRTNPTRSQGIVTGFKKGSSLI